MKLNSDFVNGMHIINESNTISNTFQVPVDLTKVYMLGYVFDADGDMFEFHRARSSGQIYIQRLIGSNTLTSSYDSTTQIITFTLSRTSLFFVIYF